MGFLFSAPNSLPQRRISQDDNKSANGRNQNFEADHTVLSGVVIGWGHGWGWGQAEMAAQSTCVHDSSLCTSLHYSADDYTIGGYEDVDWSAFGDFTF